MLNPKSIFFAVFCVFSANVQASVEDHRVMDNIDVVTRSFTFGVSESNREAEVGAASKIYKHWLMLKQDVGTGNRLIPVDDYLKAEERRPISKAFGLVDLIKERPNDFIQLVLKSAPHTLETVESDLKTYYYDVIQIDGLVASLPLGQTPQERLVGLLVEILVWDQAWAKIGPRVRDQVSGQVSGQVGGQIRDQVMSQAWDQLGARVWAESQARVWDQVRAQVRDQVRARDWGQLWDQLWDQIGDRVGPQVGDQVSRDLSHFQFSSAIQSGELHKDVLRRLLSPAIDYTFMVYQLASFSILHSDQIKAIKADFSHSISSVFTEEQALEILWNLEIPDAPEDNDLIDTQLKRLKMHLSTAS